MYFLLICFLPYRGHEVSNKARGKVSYEKSRCAANTRCPLSWSFMADVLFSIISRTLLDPEHGAISLAKRKKSINKY